MIELDKEEVIQLIKDKLDEGNSLTLSKHLVFKKMGLKPQEYSKILQDEPSYQKLLNDYLRKIARKRYFS